MKVCGTQFAKFGSEGGFIYIYEKSVTSKHRVLTRKSARGCL